jgi:hypothetical protein
MIPFRLWLAAMTPPNTKLFPSLLVPILLNSEIWDIRETRGNARFAQSMAALGCHAFMATLTVAG